MRTRHPDVRRLLRRAALLFSFCCFGMAPAQAQDDGRISLFGHHYSLIAGASIYNPRDSGTRALYGDATIEPSIGLWSFDTAPGLGLALDLGGRRMSEGGRRADMLHGGLGPRYQFVSSHADVAPYLAVRGSAYVVRFDHGRWRTKPGADVELGASLLRHFAVSVRYDFVPKVEGTDLSGFGARAAIKLF